MTETTNKGVTPEMKEVHAKELQEHIDALYKEASKSDKFKEIRGNIMNLLKVDNKYDERVVSFPSRLFPGYMGLPGELLGPLNEINAIRGITKAGILESPFNVSPYNKSPFDQFVTFEEDPTFVTELERNILEYNPAFKQLVVGAYITDGNSIVLLNTKDTDENRIRGKVTFIQGHVSANDPDVYILPQEDYLLKQMQRELDEELKIEGGLLRDHTPQLKYLISDSSNHIGLEHFGVIYEIKIPNVKAVKEIIKSGEEDKHEIVMIEMKEFREDIMRAKGYEADNWVKLLTNIIERN
jgi:predicted NUDIX family phosphoesterase